MFSRFVNFKSLRCLKHESNHLVNFQALFDAWSLKSLNTAIIRIFKFLIHATVFAMLLLCYGELCKQIPKYVGPHTLQFSYKSYSILRD